jgi:hypothetical protein
MLFARWKDGGIAAKSTSDELVNNVDMLPTLFAAAGVQYPGYDVDGLSWLDIATKDATSTGRDTIFVEMFDDRAAIQKKYKFVSIAIGTDKTTANANVQKKYPQLTNDVEASLYDLTGDGSEQKDLIALTTTDASVISSLKTLLETHNAATLKSPAVKATQPATCTAPSSDEVTEAVTGASTEATLATDDTTKATTQATTAGVDCSGGPNDGGTKWGPGVGPPPAGCGKTDGNGGATEGGDTGGGCRRRLRRFDLATSRSRRQNGVPQSTSNHAAAMLGDVAVTTVEGKDALSGGIFCVGENIFGPFEAGFTAQQDANIERLGCVDPSDGYVDGGMDTYTAEQKIATACDVILPRYSVDGNYISLLDECGGYSAQILRLTFVLPDTFGSRNLLVFDDQHMCDPNPCLLDGPFSHQFPLFVGTSLKPYKRISFPRASVLLV